MVPQPLTKMGLMRGDDHSTSFDGEVTKFSQNSHQFHTSISTVWAERNREVKNEDGTSFELRIALTICFACCSSLVILCA